MPTSLDHWQLEAPQWILPLLSAPEGFLPGCRVPDARLKSGYLTFLRLPGTSTQPDASLGMFLQFHTSQERPGCRYERVSGYYARTAGLEPWFPKPRERLHGSAQIRRLNFRPRILPLKRLAALFWAGTFDLHMSLCGSLDRADRSKPSWLGSSWLKQMGHRDIAGWSTCLFTSMKSILLNTHLVAWGGGGSSHGSRDNQVSGANITEDHKLSDLGEQRRSGSSGAAEREAPHGGLHRLI